MKQLDIRKRVIDIILLIVWLLIIFLFSSQNGVETSETSGFFTKVLNVVVKDENAINRSKIVIRKIAHYVEYTILALLTINVIKDYKEINYKLLLLTFILCFLYACSDEWHQTFVDGREGAFIDVLLDSTGILTGIILYKCFKKRK